MKNTGLFDLLQNHIIHSLVDYVMGVEAGMDTHGRKNRTGDAMEDLVEGFIQKAGFIKDISYNLIGFIPVDVLTKAANRKSQIFNFNRSIDGCAEKRRFSQESRRFFLFFSDMCPFWPIQKSAGRDISNPRFFREFLRFLQNFTQVK